MINWLDELKAQLESHPEAEIMFIVDEDDEPVPVEMTNVQYTDGQIQVMLEP